MYNQDVCSIFSGRVIILLSYPMFREGLVGHVQLDTDVYVYSSSFFFRKMTALGVLCCFALVFVWPCLILPSFCISH